MRLSHVTKSFGANKAVDDVSLDFKPGEIVGLVGENGAGKTTLMSIAAGELTQDTGTVDYTKAGIVHQHFLLVNEFTIAENLALAMWGRDAMEIIRDSGIDLRGVGRRVADLSVGEKSKLELIKAIAGHPRFLILDEPTSVLAPAEARELFDVMRRLAADGTTVVFISHKIPEVLEVASRIVVMRRGRIVVDGGAMSAEELAEAMVEKRSREVATTARSIRGEPILELDALKVHPGEIVAIIGVAGNGQSELAAKLRDTLRGRVAHIPEDRARDGLIAEMTIAENIALAEPRWSPRAATRRAAELIERFDIRAQSPLQRAGSLSGGNQQKVILARELERKPEIIVAAEPTRGLDIEATRFVHDELRSAAARGAAILLITSDLDEAFALGDTIHVIYRGVLSARLTPEEAASQAPRLMAGVGSRESGVGA
ncbi:MAG: ATP-binding cassette domain-containing protein [Acidobacteria bacterium]|nr:ATP-binding cassette domain-containing protein [Acidobacteriota bacterium]MBV9069274.1 ATP-binding cassette domain-containing protein [Acidobacteriota bacterium]MBV9184310.1 ATP-binding cassette domain-containing protein [Acidobacteriota bacterium]